MDLAGWLTMNNITYTEIEIAEILEELIDSIKKGDAKESYRMLYFLKRVLKKTRKKSKHIFQIIEILKVLRNEIPEERRPLLNDIIAILVEEL